MLVWSRALGVLTPLSSKLGAMLYILRRGAEEAGVLVPVVIVLLLVSGRNRHAMHCSVPLSIYKKYLMRCRG